MLKETLSQFNFVTVDGKEYAVIQALADGLALAILVEGIDSAVSEIKVIRLN